LSGGEKSRLALARLLLQPTNLLILDEPTNHLDMLSKEVLKQALMEYDGSMIVVSHDRDFLDGLTERVFAFRLGTTKEYLGDIDDYVNSLKQGESGKGRDGEVRDGEVRDSKVRDSKVSEVKSVAAALEPVKPHELTREEVKELNRQKKKLEKRIEDIERQVGVQEKTITECEKEMADPELYKDPVQSHKITKRYETAKQLVTSLMAEWETCSQQLEGVGS
jgi:ATP-binding cassette subfamily F protein 3